MGREFSLDDTVAFIGVKNNDATVLGGAKVHGHLTNPRKGAIEIFICSLSWVGHEELHLKASEAFLVIN
jgi:hypothetical protein